MIRVIIADDHNMVRRSLRMLLEKTDDIEVVDEARDGQEAIELVECLVPDVVVMDIVIPNLNGIQATEQVRSMGLETQVVILSVHCDETMVQQALQNGAKGYVLKDSTVKELPMAVRAMKQGKIYLSPAISELVTSGQVEFNKNRAIDSPLVI